jgi:hypothetical protein
MFDKVGNLDLKRGTPWTAGLVVRKETGAGKETGRCDTSRLRSWLLLVGRHELGLTAGFGLVI